MASPEAERFADVLRNAPKMVDMDLAHQRAAGEHAEDLVGEAPGVRYDPVEARRRAGTQHLEKHTAEPADVHYEPVAEHHPVDGLWAVPPDAPPGCAVLYLFGGGHVISSVASRRKFAGHLALAVGARVLVLDYPLAPEQPYPADVGATTDGYGWLLDEGYPARGLALVGESSAGGLVLSTLLALAGRSAPRPAAAYLMSPWADLTCSGASFASRAALDLECTRASLLRMAGQYLAGHAPADPAVSPVFAPLDRLAAALPPLLVQVGGHEVLLDDAVAVVRSAGMAGVPATLEIWPEMQHFFQLGVGVYPEAAEALGRAGRWLADRLAVDRS